MAQVDQRRFDNQRSEFLGARDASRFLGVKLETLYAYASRGLVRSEPGAKGRGRKYARSDLERLKTRRDARSGHGPVAASALRWGEPVLATAISAIRTDGPWYRGESAVKLARDGTRFEAVAELLWSGSLDPEARFPRSETVAVVRRLRGAVPPGHPTLHALLAVLPRLALLDPDRFLAPEDAERARARRLVRALAALCGLPSGDDVVLRAAAADTVAESLAIALGVSSRRARATLDATLVLTADHELNASTFAARVVASTGADLYACLLGALSALTGPRHGGASDRVEALLDEVGEPERARAVIAARTGRGEALPGFGHPLYPAGDPRVPPLLEMANGVVGNSGRLTTLLAVVAAMSRAGREPPNLDFGLVAVRRALGLPRGSASVLFALGRTAGWVAHALEQREAGYLLRPRAEYVGKYGGDHVS